MLWTIDCSWFSKEEFSRKPDWLGEGNLVFFKKFKNWVKYNSFENTTTYYNRRRLSYFLWTRTTFYFLHKLGNTPHWAQSLNNNDNFITSASQILSNLIEISSWPWALFTLSDLIISRTSSSLKVNLVSVFSPLYWTAVGNLPS